jgi:hypothetical protein
MPFDGNDYSATVLPVTQMLTVGREQVKRGWCQGSMRQRGSACMIGSLVVDDFDVFTNAESLLLSAIRQLGYAHASVASFNDDLHRTKDQVLDVYDRAIAESMPVTAAGCISS